MSRTSDSYLTPSQETIDLIESLFDCDEFNFETDPDRGYFIKAKNMFDYAKFKEGSVLTNYIKIAQMLGVDFISEYSKHSYGGCETCDYGSSYFMDLRFWSTQVDG